MLPFDFCKENSPLTFKIESFLFAKCKGQLVKKTHDHYFVVGDRKMVSRQELSLFNFGIFWNRHGLKSTHTVRNNDIHARVHTHTHTHTFSEREAENDWYEGKCKKIIFYSSFTKNSWYQKCITTTLMQSISPTFYEELFLEKSDCAALLYLQFVIVIFCWKEIVKKLHVKWWWNLPMNDF